MARIQINQYIFTPSGPGSGTVKVPNYVDLSKLLLIQNITSGVTIFNFSDPLTSATKSFDQSDTTTFPNSLNGCTTFTLTADTSGQNSTDVLSIYIESDVINVALPTIGTDAVNKTRISTPFSLIDADFEYGIQNTKWQSAGAMRGIPSVYELPGADITVFSVTSSGEFRSQIQVSSSTSHSLRAGSVFSLFGLDGATTDRAEGYFVVLSTGSATTFNYEARGRVVPSGSNLVTSYTNLRAGGFYASSALPIISLIGDNASPTSSLTASTSSPHGLLPGTPLIITDTGSFGHVGEFFVDSVPNGNTFIFVSKSQQSGSQNISSASFYARNESFFIHRPFDGGVLLGTALPIYGLEAKRQSKRYFRYQSGKGIMWSTGILFAPSFDVNNATFTSPYITINTDPEHYLQKGATIKLNGFDSVGYSGSFKVYDIINSNTLRVSASNNTPVDITGSMSLQPKISVTNWVGARVQAGLFDDSNGMYFEYDGNVLSVNRRTSTTQLAGTISVTPNSFSITGSNTRFTQQLKIGDSINIRGMLYTVSSISNDVLISVTPAYRGVRSYSSLKTSLVSELKIPQSEFNIDKLDGTGPSGYTLDISKMQMMALQYSWYGAGFIDFGCRGALGDYIWCHRVKNNNINYEAFMRTGNLPARYESSNYGAISTLISSSGIGSNQLYIRDGKYFPTASTEYPIYCILTSNQSGIIQNEIISYTNITSSVNNNLILGGVTRNATYSPYIYQEFKNFKGTNDSIDHTSGSTIFVYNNTFSPTLSHWGSSVIIDGNFDQDRGYQFNLSRTNVSLSIGQTSTVLLFRLAPSVSNTIQGDLGDREIINRSQVLLKRMEVTATAKMEIYGVLNPTNISSSFAYTSSAVVQVQGSNVTATQPSFSQYSTSFTSAPIQGEILFRITVPAAATLKSEIDLTQVKDLNNSIFGGRNTFPDGPDVLAIVATCGAAAGTLDLLLQWQEAQA